MMSKNTTDKQFQFTGWHMLACMISFFGVIIAVNFYMAFTASSSWTGLVVKNSYVASQKFNRDLEVAKVQKAAGWRSRIVYQDGILSVRLVTRSGSPLILDNVSMRVGRPAYEQQDQNVLFVTNEDGVLTTNLNLASGEWLLKITGDVEGKPYRRDARLLVNENFTGEIR